MEIRPYRSADCQEMAALFYDTVHSVNARDYSPQQLDAWADGHPDLDAWNRSFLAHISLVAKEAGRITGFADLDPAAGYLDRLYVHKDCQGRGIAGALCGALENAAKTETVTTYASITARPFFEGRGYRVVRENLVERRGVALKNFLMEKNVRAAGR